MSINLIETVQQNLGYPPLQKIDPNTQETVATQQGSAINSIPLENKFSQAAIPAVLTALHNYVRTDEGAASFLKHEIHTNWLNEIFNKNKKEVMQAISSYTLQPNTDMDQEMNEIAKAAVGIVKKNLPEHPDLKDVKLFFSGQATDILLYLPASLHLGKLLGDDTLDDTTNKMEGPVSSLIQSIGSVFANPVTDNEIKKS